MSMFYPTEFIEGISQFSVKGDKESKLRCKYSLLDMCAVFYFSINVTLFAYYHKISLVTLAYFICSFT